MSDDARLPLRAHMALDGELDAANTLAFEEELAKSPELAAEYARLRALSQTLRAHEPREAAPERLRRRIEALAAPAIPAPVFKPAAWAAMAASFAMVAALAGFWAGRATRGGKSEVAALVAGYQRAALSDQPIDIASSDRHTVKPWLAAHAPLGAVAPDLGEDGYPLAGGRIDILDRRPVPTLVYRRGKHLISVSELPLSEAGGGAMTLDGYHVERWRDGERAYVAVSDIEAPGLAAFAATFRKRALP